MDKNIHFQHTKDDAELQYIFYVNLSIFNLYCINSSLRILTSTRFPISSVSWITQAKIRTKRILTDAIGDVANGDRGIAFVGIWKNPRGRHQTISFRLENKWIYAVCHITIIFSIFPCVGKSAITNFKLATWLFIQFFWQKNLLCSVFGFCRHIHVRAIPYFNNGSLSICFTIWPNLTQIPVALP